MILNNFNDIVVVSFNWQLEVVITESEIVPVWKGSELQVDPSIYFNRLMIEFNFSHFLLLDDRYQEFTILDYTSQNILQIMGGENLESETPCDFNLRRVQKYWSVL